MKKHYILWGMFLFACVCHVTAQSNSLLRYNISYLTMQNGLPHNFVDDIYKDSQGFLWISTAGGGLARYDGYEFVNFNTSNTKGKLRSNFIQNVCEDAHKRLWIVSEGGTSVLDLASRNLIIPADEKGLINEILKKPSIKVYKDSQNAIWLCCTDYIYKISFQTDSSVKEIAKLKLNVQPIPSIALCDVDEDGSIWVGLENKVCKLTAHNSVIVPQLVSPKLIFDKGTFISVFKLKENEVWIGSDKGLYRYNKTGNMVKHYTYSSTNTYSISQNYISDMAVTTDKQLIVTTLRGANIYNPITDTFEHLNQENNDNTTRMNSNFVNCVFVDKNIVWFGTETGGLNKLTPRRLSLRNYVYDKDDLNSISRNPVNAIYEDKKGTLWVGTVEGGLNRKSKGENRFHHYTAESSYRLSHNSVSAIAADNQNRLWVGTWGLGINLLDINNTNRPVIQYLNSDTHPNFPINFIGSLCYDTRNNLMWIGSNHGLYYYDLNSETFKSPFKDQAGEKIHGCIGAIIDKENQLWIGCLEGLYIVDLNKRENGFFKYKHITYKLDDPASGLNEKITCFYLAKDGTMWIGSNGYGFYKAQKTSIRGQYKFKAFTTSEGLVNNSIRGILEDNYGWLWISSNNGLSCFNPANEHFINYNSQDGLICDQFYWNAYCKSKTGDLYFGSLNGLSVISPNHSESKSSLANVIFTKLKVGNEEVIPGSDYLDQDISLCKEIRIHEKEKSFSIEFSSLNFDQQATAVYSYRLLGFDEDWVEVSADRRFASYTNLQPGTYTLQVMYSSDKSMTNAPVSELTIIIKPYFYKTTWFIFLVVLFIGTAVYQFYLWRIRTLKRQKEILHRKVEQRTRELESQKEVLEIQTAELSRQNNLLIQQNEKITKQKTQLLRMSKKVQELTLDKLSFFTNITHEFRTPITLIIGPIERALKLSSNPQVIEQLNFVERNSKYLLSLVNQLMDFRKVESGKLEIVRSKGNFLEFIHSIIAPFEIFAKERNITISRLCHLNNPLFLFDEDAMHKVIANLLSNAIKFTPNNGNIIIYVASIQKSGEEVLYIAIKDNGTGIANEDVDKIFNRFYQSRSHVKYPVYGQSGTGIGLYLCKRIIQLNNGSISAKNNRAGGSTFRMTIPLIRENQQENAVSTLKNQLQLVTESSESLRDKRKTLKTTILVVEDNNDMRAYIRSILEETYHVIEAENGAVALTKLSEYNVDFIISDLMMPVMDGLEFSKKVKENFNISHIPFLMLTAKTSSEAKLQSYKIGVDEYLLKPFDEEMLLTRIQNILENRKRYQQQFSAKMEIEELQIEEESSDKKFIDKVMEIVKANYKNSYYEISDLVEAMGISKSLFNKKMQSLVGQPAGQFLRNYRLNIAYELILKNKKTKNMNISEIAYEVGFNDPKYFTRCFTKHFNVLPSSLMDE